MSDAWLDLLRLAVMGAVGLGGAWLGAQATRRKERWGHRRELYQPILSSLMDLYIHSRHRLRLEEESDSADPKSQVWLKETTERAAAAMTCVWHSMSLKRNGRTPHARTQATGKPRSVTLPFRKPGILSRP